MEREQVKELLLFQIRRQITNLYKQNLIILEDYPQDKHNIVESYKRARKRILDAGNSSIRELEELINSLEIGLKK